jgi:hypothetical protein
MEAVRSAHEAIADHLTPTTRAAFESIVAPFGVLGPGLGDDLGVRRDFLAITISPLRVESTIASLADPDWWEELQEAYVQYHEPDPDWWLGNLDEFLDYLRGFIDLVEMAHAEGYGIVVDIQ